MGSLFRLADKGATDTYYFGDEELGDERDFIRVRSSLTKGESNEILSIAPTQERDLKGGFAFLEKFFKEVIVEWSLTDEEGAPLPPTVENYRNMDAAGARLIEEKLGQHLNKLIGREVEKAEGESSS
jgi:hypothetical protein